MSFLEHLNPEQQRAVTAGEGPLLVLAGAGSGKTRVLTARIGHLIREQDVRPYRILAFTFTNKAAREMRQRIEAMLGDEAFELWIGTFHSTGVRLLRREASRLGWDRSFAIYDTSDSEAVVKDLIASRTLPRHLSVSELRNQISHWKNDRVDHEEAKARAGDSIEELMASLYSEYDRALRRNNAFDFDDLIAKPVELFEREPETLHRYADRFRYVLVDEFQDTNHLQMRYIEQLSSVHGNLFVVGDDDQSIYGWRGARIENILEFENRFQGTQTIRLEQNYRSTTPILEAANAVIAHNRGRKGKNLWTAREGGEKITLRQCFDEEEEATQCALLVQSLVESGRKRQDISYLYRTNAQSRALEDALRRHNIPYQIVGGTRFYERREVRDIVSYLKAIQNPADSVALQRIINVPRRGIGNTSLAKLVSAADSRGLGLNQVMQDLSGVGLASSAVKRVLQFKQLMRELHALNESGTCVQVVQAVLDATNYFDYLRDSDPASYAARRENVEELVSAAQAFCEESEDQSLRAFLEEISLLSDIDSMEDTSDQVTLMTVHSAKGLEFPVVLITGLEEGLLPHAINSSTPGEVEEERRLFYVAMTRAKDALHLFAANNRRRFGDFQPMMLSRFADEIPKDTLQEVEDQSTRTRRGPWQREQPSWRSYAEGNPDSFWKSQGLKPQPVSEELYEDDFPQEEVTLQVGMRVKHAKFGEGIVQRIEGKGEMMKITVVFGRSDTKKLVARYARLIPIL